MEYPALEIDSVETFIGHTRETLAEWSLGETTAPWFRGQPDWRQHLIPTVFRYADDEIRGRSDDEYWLADMFRNRSQYLGQPQDVGRIDKWLFLMRHHGLPTRLLDWTESLLVAVYFAVSAALAREDDGGGGADYAAVWMLHPLELNRLTCFRGIPLARFPDSWTHGDVGSLNFEYVFTENPPAPDELVERDGVYYRDDVPVVTRYPIAVQPIYVHPRLMAQKSVFTVHGAIARDIESIFFELDLTRFLRKYLIPKERLRSFLADLIMLGVTQFTIFPDLEGLAVDLRQRFGLRRRPRT